jgi:hypothetical protein
VLLHVPMHGKLVTMDNVLVISNSFKNIFINPNTIVLYTIKLFVDLFICLFDFVVLYILVSCGAGYKNRVVSCYNTMLDPTMTNSAPVDDALCLETQTKPADQDVTNINIQINIHIQIYTYITMINCSSTMCIYVEFVCFFWCLCLIMIRLVILVHV